MDIERSPRRVAMIDGKMNVRFFVNTSRNRGHRGKRTKEMHSAVFLFVSIVIHFGISIREKTKISMNVANGGRVLIINGDVRPDNASTKTGYPMVNGTVQMLRINTSTLAGWLIG